MRRKQNDVLEMISFFRFRIFFERDRILNEVQEMMKEFDNDICLLYYLKIIKTLRAKESDLRFVEFENESIFFIDRRFFFLQMHHVVRRIYVDERI